MLFSVLVDIDECVTGEANQCDANALCTNTEGFYVCRCLNGYEGDGRKCEGTNLKERLDNVFMHIMFVALKFLFFGPW